MLRPHSGIVRGQQSIFKFGSLIFISFLITYFELKNSKILVFVRWFFYKKKKTFLEFIYLTI